MEDEIRIIRNAGDLESVCSPGDLAEMLADWLGDWGDPPDMILDALAYVFSEVEGKGGFLALALRTGRPVGILVMLDTGMGSYIPRHHLVYVAVDPGFRGSGLGGQLVRKGMETAGTSISLHLDEDNPALRLYERLGFSVKYLEMRTSET